MASFKGGNIPENALKIRSTDQTEEGVVCLACSQAKGFYSCYTAVLPHFGDTEMVTFTCRACEYTFNKVCGGVDGGESEKSVGRKIIVLATEKADLRREVKISEFASVLVPELDLQIQISSDGGRLTTIEGLVRQVCTRLGVLKIAGESLGNQDQGSVGTRVDSFVSDIENGNCVENPKEIVIDDPSGASFVAGRGVEFASHTSPGKIHTGVDTGLIVTEYELSASDVEMLGLGETGCQGEEEEEVVITRTETKATAKEMMDFLNDIAGAFGCGVEGDD